MEGRHCFDHLTVEENLLTGAFTRRDGGAAIRADLELVYAYFPRLKERRASLAGYTSGGEQQMCAIGRALMSRPKLILLDEPSMGLAPQIVEEIFEIVQRLEREEGVSFLLAEQNTNMALKYAGYGYVLENGRVVLDGEPRPSPTTRTSRSFISALPKAVAIVPRRQALQTAQALVDLMSVPLETLLPFAALCLGLVLTPGPNMIYLMSRSLSQGWRAGAVSLAGTVVGFVIFVLCAALGLTAHRLRDFVPLRRHQIRRAAYLLVAGVAAAPARRHVDVVTTTASSPASAGRLVAMGSFDPSLDPKVALLYIALLPQFVDPARGELFAQYVVLGLCRYPSAPR